MPIMVKHFLPPYHLNIHLSQFSHPEERVGRNIQNKDSFTIPGLWPGMRYMLHVTATNSAGTTVAEYTVTTLPVMGGTFGPDLIVESEEAVPVYMDVGVMLPLVISLLAVVAFSTGVYVCLRRKQSLEGLHHESDGDGRQSQGHSDASHDMQAMVALDNKHNLAQREQYYAAVQKGITTHAVERIPEYAEDISPYATFHVQGQGQGHKMSSSPGHMQTFVYHDHRLAAMETMQLKSANPHDDYTKLRVNQKTKRVRSESSDYSASTDCKSEIGPVPRTKSRGEHISLQTILYPAGGEGTGGGPESSTSPEQSPVPDRRNPARRHRHNVRRQNTSIPLATCLDPPTGFSDGHELSEAECDMDTIRRLKRPFKSCDNGCHSCGEQEYSHKNFTIAV